MFDVQLGDSEHAGFPMYGTVHFHQGRRVYVKFSDVGDPQSFDERCVERFDPISDETMALEFKMKAPGVVQSLNRVVHALFEERNFLGDVKEFIPEPCKIDEDHISIFDNTLTVDPTPIEIKTIGGYRQVFGWNITAYRQLPSFDRDVPPEVAEDCRGQARNDIEVCRLVCKALFEDRLEAQLENLDISQMLEEERLRDGYIE